MRHRIHERTQRLEAHSSCAWSHASASRRRTSQRSGALAGLAAWREKNNSADCTCLAGRSTTENRSSWSLSARSDLQVREELAGTRFRALDVGWARLRQGVPEAEAPELVEHRPREVQVR